MLFNVLLEAFPLVLFGPEHGDAILTILPDANTPSFVLPIAFPYLGNDETNFTVRNSNISLSPPKAK